MLLLTGIIILLSYGATCNKKKDKDTAPATVAGSSVIPEAVGITDTDFGLAGVVTSAIGGSCYINGLAIQADGKILWAGLAYSISNDDFAVARYDTNGVPDNAFGTNGTVTNTIGASTDQITKIEIQTDSKIVAAGYGGFGPIKPALARYTADGALDPTFGTNGILTATISTGNAVFNDLKIQTDGKIVAGGYRDSAFYLMRYTTAGVPDSSFGTDGAITTTIGTGSDEMAYDIALQSDGKILLCGYSSSPSDYYGFIARYNTNGSLDSSFGANGVVTQTIATYTDIEYYGMSLQANGRIVVVGYADSGIILARYNTNGTLDTGFGVDGIIIVPTTATYTYANDVKIQADGRIVVGGRIYQGGLNRSILIRYK